VVVFETGQVGGYELTSETCPRWGRMTLSNARAGRRDFEKLRLREVLIVKELFMLA